MLGVQSVLLSQRKKCPHFEKLKPITDAMDEANVIILASPVYVYHTTGAIGKLFRPLRIQMDGAQSRRIYV